MNLLNLDNQIFHIINSLASKSQILDLFGIFCAKYLIFILFIIYFIWWIFLSRTKPSENWPMLGKRKWLDLFSVILAVALAILINYLLSFAHFRARPFISSSVINLIGNPFSVKSFPSDHTAVVFALALAVWFYNKKLGYIFLVSAVFVGIARIFTGVHYPADIIAGSLVGLLAALVIRLIFLKIFIKK